MTDTPARTTIAAAKTFAQRCHDELGVPSAVLFGSLVYRDGERFSEDVSDVDLALVMPEGMRSPVDRVELAAKLLGFKRDLEIGLAVSLSRSTAVPVCSLMLLSAADIGADIHKDGAEGFFRNNEFHDLVSDARSHGMAGVGDVAISHRLVRQCIRFAQKKRHAFLAIAANGKGSLEGYDGDTPLPKDILRHAAMAGALRKTGALPGAEFDTQEGLSELVSHVIHAAKKSQAYEELRVWLMNKIATRKGILSARHQLLLAETIAALAEQAHDAAKTNAQPPKVESTPFFFERVGDAFPGKRGIYWTTGPEDVAMRLGRLLGGELRIGLSTPIWMFRGGVSIGIEQFRQIGPETFLIGHHELKVSRLALCESPLYYRNFVYVECEGLAPTGIDDSSAERLKEAIKEGRSTYEEYGLTDDGMLVTREEYDDGAAERAGKIIDTSHRTEIRMRYLTPFNFVLCAQMSPINNTQYDRRFGELLDGMLAGQNLLPTIIADVSKLPRRDDD
ncbi:hypothetical protein [Sandarakinorhabdus sp.]|uniref:hypothetical protein n=1 Tax=Sandarakinorhabdus sp. TaxID=1916663 RepID=UPI00286DFEBD|nr:hypothetical protein [Sandarakinorhabdus sp.]